MLLITSLTTTCSVRICTKKELNIKICVLILSDAIQMYYSYFICALSNLSSAQDLSKWSLYELGTRLLDVEIKHGGLPMEVTLLAFY